MVTLSFDEINKRVGLKKSMPFERFFGEMPIKKHDKQRRISLAEELVKEFDYLFVYILVLAEYGKLDWEAVKEETQKRYLDVAEKHITVDKEFIEYVDDFAEEFVDVTQRHEDEPYYFSHDRANLIAENESNTDFNYDDYFTAKATHKSRKRWVSMKDDAVRLTHAFVDDTVIGIDELFVVGNALMRFPRDTYMAYAHPEEICGCRCVAEYF